jgi:thiol:disulfide interchange protein DsbA
MIRKGWFLLITLLLTFGGVHAEEFSEGIEYERLKTPVPTTHPDKVVVTELFWYGCPHCFRFEPYIEKWKQGLPDSVVFEQYASVLNPSWMEHARAFFALKAMGELDKAHQKIFGAIHLQRQSLDNVESMARFVASHGVDEKTFRSHYHSFPVDTEIRKSRQKERKYGHRGVPAVVINGKYRTSASMAGSNAQMINVINYLVKRELAEN